MVFFCYYDFEGGFLAVPLDFTFITYTVILPVLGFIWVSYGRREQCLALLSEAKCILISTIYAHKDWYSSSPPSDGNDTTGGGGGGRVGERIKNSNSGGGLSTAQVAIAALLPALRSYFLPSRFYTRNYPYIGYKSAMIQIALDRARVQRQIRDCVATIDAAATTARFSGLPTSLEAILHERAHRLSVVIDQMSNVKEFGTPQGVRSIARCYICLIIPLFFAPYWAWVSKNTNFAIAFFISIAVQIALNGLLNVAMALEDPFDNSGMDGIFIDEQLYDVEQVLLGSGADPQLIMTSDGSGGNTGAGGGGGNGQQQQQQLQQLQQSMSAVANGAAPGASGLSGPMPVPQSMIAPPASQQRVVRVATDTV